MSGDIDVATVVSAFCEAARGHRILLRPEQVVGDGRTHRADLEGDAPGTENARYRLYLDDHPAGWFQNHKDDDHGFQTWRFAQGMSYRQPARSTRVLDRLEEAKRRQRELHQQQEDAAKRAQSVWVSALPCETFPYLERKKVRSIGLRICHSEVVISGTSCKGALLVPAYDATQKLTTLQFILEDGRKLFLPRARKLGAWFTLGTLTPDANVACVAEGYATGATIHAATGYPVIVAFDAGNLEPVVLQIQHLHPKITLIICADDDRFTENNPGVKKANGAAHAVGGYVAVPAWHPDEDKGTDFNDLVCLDEINGLARVKATIEKSLGRALVTTTPLSSTREASPPVTFNYAGGQFLVNHSGVWYQPPPNNSGEEPTPQWICAELHVIAQTRTNKSEEWGRLLVWHDEDGIRHQWAMPNELLQGDGQVVRQELARLGLQMGHGRKARDLLSSFLSTYPCSARARCVDRLGWQGGIYITPSESIGQENEIVVFQNVQVIEPALSVSGSVDDWKQSVAALAQGNSRLVFALSVAFAAALVEIVGADSGGFHFRGKSSSGKTTALKITASVWGDPNTYPRLWRATTNGLEGLAALHNDGLLILDELSQMDAKDVGEAAYLLANGQGKSRASKFGSVRQAAKWRLLFLSAGEESLSAMMAKAGKKANAGQEVRLADIDADAGAEMGIFENLHDKITPSAMALAIKDAAQSYYGAVGEAWLRRIVADRPELADFLKDGIEQFTKEVLPSQAEGQVVRVAQRFGLVATAGELATHYGLTGWPADEAIAAVKRCFLSWLGAFGGAGNREDRALLAQVKAFLEAHGSSRFEEWDNASGRIVVNRAGFRKVNGDGRVTFYVLPEAFKEICKGFEPKMAGKTLAQAGWIVPDSTGGNQQKPRLPEMGPTRCYVFTARVWEDEHAA